MKGSKDDFQSFSHKMNTKIYLDTRLWRMKNDCSGRGTILGFKQKECAAFSRGNATLHEEIWIFGVKLVMFTSKHRG